MARYRIRSPIARARGLGSAKAGFGHWWTERVTAVALVPLTAWLAVSVVIHGGEDHATVTAWLGSAFTVVPMTLLLIALFWHTALGLQVIVEDYVHSSARIWALLAVRFLCLALATTGILALLRIAFVSGGTA